MDTRPIGFFDSGSGGLTIWQAVTSLLPEESTIYIGDHSNIPYGVKPASYIKSRGTKIIKKLIEVSCKLIVVACNTATVMGIDSYRQSFPDTPIVGVVPVVKTAATTSRNKRFAILATPTTINSEYQKGLIQEFAKECEIISIPDSKLVTLIEHGVSKKLLHTHLKSLLVPVIYHSIDSLVLGCTHFPFIKKDIEKIVGPDVLVLDSGGAVARQVERILIHNALRTDKIKATYKFFTTGDTHMVSVGMTRLLKHNISVKHVTI